LTKMRNEVNRAAMLKLKVSERDSTTESIDVFPGESRVFSEDRLTRPPPSTLYKSEAMSYGVSLTLAEEYLLLNEDLEDARELAEVALKTAEHSKEDDNIYAAYAEGVLADILLRQGLYLDAAHLFKGALRRYESHFMTTTGPQAVETVAATQLISWSHLAERNYEEAVSSCTAALGMTRKLLGESADTAGAAFNLATALLNNGQLDKRTEALFNESISMYERLSETETEAMGDNVFATSIATAHEGLGHLYFLRGNDERAEKEWGKVWQAYEDGELKDATSTAPSLKNLADIRLRRSDFEGARQLFSMALEVLEASPEYGPTHERSLELKKNVEAIDHSMLKL